MRKSRVVWFMRYYLFLFLIRVYRIFLGSFRFVCIIVFTMRNSSVGGLFLRSL